MTKELIDLAIEIANCRDHELPFKLLKLKGILFKNSILKCNFLYYFLFFTK